MFFDLGTFSSVKNVLSGPARHALPAIPFQFYCNKFKVTIYVLYIFLFFLGPPVQPGHLYFKVFSKSCFSWTVYL